MAKRSSGDTPRKPVAMGPFFRFCWQQLTPYRVHLVWMSCALLAAAGAMLGLGGIIRRLVDMGFDSPDMLQRIMLQALGLVVLLTVATYSRFYYITTISERVVASIRNQLFSHLIFLTPSFYETTRVGEVVTRVTTDTNELQWMFGSSISMALRHLVLFVGGLGMLIITSPTLALYLALALPLIFIPILVLGKKVRRLSRATQDKVADLGATVEETLVGIRTVQAYTREAEYVARFGQVVEESLRIARQRVRARALLVALVILLSFGALLGLLWVGGVQVLHGALTAGQLSAFLFYAMVVAGSVASLSEVVGDVQRAAGAIEAIMRLMAVEQTVKNPPLPVSLSLTAPPEIRYEQVQFTYPSAPDKSALSGCDFTVKAGSTVALVGPSGAGKSTLFQLLLRFYDPAQGSVRINNVDIRDVTLADLRAGMAYVAQDPVMFSATVRENLTMGVAGVQEDALWAALRAAQAEALARELPQGLDTYVGEKGVRLSGGEKQRLALARAILRQPKLLLLDEATSALDAANEHAVQEALKGLAGTCTTLVIAHRLATVLHADTIVVLEAGRIVAQGTHADLMASNALYQELAAKQFIG